MEGGVTGNTGVFGTPISGSIPGPPSKFSTKPNKKEYKNESNEKATQSSNEGNQKRLVHDDQEREDVVQERDSSCWCQEFLDSEICCQ